MKTLKFIALLALWGTASSALAQLSQSLLLDPKALSMGNAVTADPPGIMSIHYNPAGLTKLEDRQLSITLMNVILHSEAEFEVPEDAETENELLDISEDPTAGEKSEVHPAAFLPGVGIVPMHLPVLTLPSGGVSVNPPGSKFTFANAVYIPMAAGFYKEDDDPGRYQGKQIAIQRMTFLSPSFGYKVSDELSIGASCCSPLRHLPFRKMCEHQTY